MKMDVNPPDVLKQPLVAPHKILMGPGPSNCSSRVLHALSQPVIGHLHKECIQVKVMKSSYNRFMNQKKYIH